MHDLDLTACDREPIHAPGAIQPHGMLLLSDGAAERVLAAAGDVESRLAAPDWSVRTLAQLIGADAAACARDVTGERPGAVYLGQVKSPSGDAFDASAHRSEAGIIVELEPVVARPTPSGVLLSEIEAVAGAFERAPTIEALCRIAAQEFRRRTGYDRVMIYQFLDDESGSVLGEDLSPEMRPFLNHRFPASDIPRQARALYLRNLIRVIPDAGYSPAPVRFADSEAIELDLSDASLRSVSPIHVQYLRNMGVAASASVSIVRDGVLWGLVACHNATPRTIGYDERAACRAIAGALGRQLRAKDDTDAFRERVRLRSFQDDIVSLLSRDGSLEDAISNHVDEIRRALGGDGVAILRGGDLLTSGRCPSDGDVRALGHWALKRGAEQVYATDRLVEAYPTSAGFQSVAAGMLSVTLSFSDPWIVMWFRAEQVETVEWAGNPHKDDPSDPEAVLTPRASFDVWRETVRGRSRRWTTAEVEAAGRLRAAVIEVWQSRGLMELNRQLVKTIDEKDLLIQQKEFLIGEVNHRVQNSLQLVSSFLALQGRSSNQPGLAPALEEARRRLTAVALVHRRLYRSDQVEAIDLARYVEELVADVVQSLGDGWARALSLNLAPVLIPTDRAISLGLVLTELMINATKYAYGGEPGPIEVTIDEHAGKIRLTVADKGVGAPAQGARRGFGSRMMEALVKQIGGEMTRTDNRPGLRVTFTAPATAVQNRSAPAQPSVAALAASPGA
ncbi:histidine kinase dimerization/phosphoacceptor domain -containing protein [Hansschlegelia zhihuaiae]|uniref:histidine kinase dimerization/phosphoacceptor domain -containing protein n=1 Tax=Hansschlegelia zhihuaiae TaxID=405005 RepID=UPI0019D45266|nr:histidine kinase dimerization/phosphoacceptor domain -containing protein [Hansschlegelia zhihuaiae]